jgi:hypothetical protein
MKKLIILTTVILTGCSTMDTAKLAASHAVTKYCSIPAGARSLAREELDKAIEPNSIKVTCSEE